MSKQEEIREKVWQILMRNGLPVFEADRALDAILNYLHSQEVVIKVDGKLPPFTCISGDDLDTKTEIQQSMLRAGYVAVEPLIKEVK